MDWHSLGTILISGIVGWCLGSLTANTRIIRDELIGIHVKLESILKELRTSDRERY